VAQGKLEEAAESYRRSLAEKPSPAVQNALAGVLRKLGKVDEAERLSAAHPANPTR